MSLLRLPKRSMRIIALPLTTASRNATHEHLTYYHFVLPRGKDENQNSWSHWVSSKATELWAGFGRADEGTWKRKTFVYGERLVDRMDFEELALKSVDPSLGPKLVNFGESDAETPSDSKPSSMIPLIYPGLACTSPLSHLKSLLEKRTPRHKRGFYMWMIIAPFTAPFMIVPIIPNLPFFFCVWRSWSHYKAYKASSYLQEFLSQGAIVAEPNPSLDQIYKEYSPVPPSITPIADTTARVTLESDASSTSSTSNLKDHPEEGPRRLILKREAVPAIMDLFQLRPDSSFAGDLYRALEQARLRMEEGEPKEESREKTE